MFCIKKILFISIMSTSLIANVQAYDDKNNEIESITVTARHQEERLIDVPMSISSISDVQLTDRNYTNATDVYRTIAGAAMTVNNGQLILRGLSGGNNGSPDTTTTFVDDIPLDFDQLIDIERIEVLRGPQGTLYGSNAIGGTVRIITKKPVLDEFELFGSTQVTSAKNVDDLYGNISLGLNIPLIDDKLAMRIVGNYEDNQLPYKNMHTNVHSEVKEGFVRSKILWKATSDLDISVGYLNIDKSSKGDFLGDGSRPGQKETISLTENLNTKYGYDVDFNYVDCPATASRPECMGGQRYSGTEEKYQLWDLLDPAFDSTTNVTTLNINHNDLFGLAKFVYAGSYSKYKEKSINNWSRLDANDLFKTWIVNRDELEETTHEIRLHNIYSKNPINWTVGVFYDKKVTDDLDSQKQLHDTGNKASAIAKAVWWDIDVTQLGINTFVDPQQNWENTLISYYQRELSFFGEFSYNLNFSELGSLELSAGIRHFDFKDSYKDESSGIWSESDESALWSEDLSSLYPEWSKYTSNDSGEESGNRFKYSVTYKPDVDTSLYALYSEGYRPGGNNSELPQSCDADPLAQSRKSRFSSDSIDNYELGIKQSLLDNTFNYSLSVYKIDWTDIRTEVYMDSCGFKYTSNVGEAESKGIEFESIAQLTDDLEITLNASHISAEIKNDNESIGAEAGDDMTMVPDTSVYIAFDYGYQLFEKDAFIRAELNYYGEYKTHFNVRDEDIVPSYTIFNVSGRFDINEELKFGIYINNIFDKNAYSYKAARSRDDSDLAAQENIQFIPERNITLRIDYTFI